MQTKRMIPLFLSLFITATVVAQNPEYTTVINNIKPLESSGSFQVTVSAGEKPTVFSLWIQNPQKRKLQLQISHRSFGTVIDTIISADDFNRRYNMEQADDGEYTVTVSSGKERVIKEIELNTITTRNVVVH